MKSGIYCILNVSNRKRYIGQSVDIGKRKSSHFSALKYGRHFNRHLQQAYNKHGDCVFEFKVIEFCETWLLDERESYWIKKFMTTNVVFGYNNESGGHREKIISEYTRSIISKSNKGRPKSEEHRKRISEGLKGIPKPTLKGRKLSEETRRKISEGHLPRTIEDVKARHFACTGKVLSDEKAERKLRGAIFRHKQKLKEAVNRKLYEQLIARDNAKRATLT